jgi:hypothetical protein
MRYCTCRRTWLHPSNVLGQGSRELPPQGLLLRAEVAVAADERSVSEHPRSAERLSGADPLFATYSLGEPVLASGLWTQGNNSTYREVLAYTSLS